MFPFSPFPPPVFTSLAGRPGRSLSFQKSPSIRPDKDSVYFGHNPSARSQETILKEMQEVLSRRNELKKKIEEAREKTLGLIAEAFAAKGRQTGSVIRENRLGSIPTQKELERRKQDKKTQAEKKKAAEISLENQQELIKQFEALDKQHDKLAEEYAKASSPPSASQPPEVGLMQLILRRGRL